MARVAVLLAALFVAAAGLLVGSIALGLSLLSPGSEGLLGATFSAAVLTLSLGLGLPAAWQAGQALRGRPSTPFRPARPWPLIALFVVALAAGQAVLALSAAPRLSSLVFMPFYVAAAALPPLVVVGLVGRALAGHTRWRDMVLQLASGALLSTFLAFVLEIGAVVGLALLLTMSLLLRPGGAALMQRLADLVQDPALLQDPGVLSAAGTSPLFVVAILAVFAGLIPVLEEGTKTLGVGLRGYGPGPAGSGRLTLARAFLWGLAGGAGFALAEGLLNSASSLDAWAVVAFTRVGATLLHCLTGALMGIAWYRLLAQGRPWSAVGLYAASVGVHGAWNTLAATLALVSLPAGGSSPLEPAAMLSSTAAVAIIGLFTLLALGVGIGLVGLTRLVKRDSPQPESPAYPTPGLEGTA